MSRKLKFRIWDKRFKGGYLTYHLIGAGMSMLTFHGKKAETGPYNDVDFGWKYEKYLLHGPEQFTGLKDKHGKEIYEGDLVKFKYHESAMFGYDKKYRYRVVWHEDECAFVVADSNDGEYFNRFCDMYKIEVIGNIFENPLT